MYTILETIQLKPGVAVKNLPKMSANGRYAIPVSGDGNGIVISMYNETVSDIALKVFAADNVFCGGDAILTFPAGGESTIHFEGAPYVQNSGEYKGMILIEGTDYEANISVMEVL